VEIVSATAIWYHTGMPPLPIRWVLIRDPQGKFRSQALLCTDLQAQPVQILARFIMRWQMEVTWASRHSDNGLTWLLGAPHRLCWACSPW
jgi:hypothetical protein